MDFISPAVGRSERPISTADLDASALSRYFKNSWQLYEWLFSALRDEAVFYERPDALRNPLIFYWGHTAAFYINKLQLAGLIQQGINPDFERLFAKGVDPKLPEHLKKDFTWPSVESVNTYRDAVYNCVLQVIDQIQGPLSVDAEHPLWALLMAIEHDRIHFETSSVLIRQLPLDMVQRPKDWMYAPTAKPPAENPLIEVPAGEVQIGKAATDPLFGWDNEHGQLLKPVSAFAATRYPVTNAAFLEFVAAGGYADARYWSEIGWNWRNRVDAQHPKFWLATEAGYRYRAMFDALDMPLDWPVEVNAHEAEAFCRWKGPNWRLMTEAEFHRIAQQQIPDTDAVFSEVYNLNLRFGSPSPVGYFKEEHKHLGFNDLFGNVWEWLSDTFYPLPDFEPHPLYEDFSAPYFDEEHAMLLGGAWATTGTAASKYYRLWFRHHFFQHAGFRLAQSR